MSNNEPETQNSNATGGLPLRGFAMVLIAVAVGLGLWGLYAVTQGGDDGSETANTAAESPAPEDNDNDAAQPSGPAPAETDGNSRGEAGQPTGDAADADAADPAGTDGANGAEDQRNDAAGDDAPANGTGGQPDDAAPAPGGGGAPAEPAQLHVLNNSTVSDLAADVSERLGEEGYELGEVGNFAEEIFPETTVFFTPGNAAAEEEAHELASRLNGVAREHVDSLPEETEDAGDITLVLIGDVAL